MQPLTATEPKTATASRTEPEMSLRAVWFRPTSCGFTASAVTVRAIYRHDRTATVEMPHTGNRYPVPMDQLASFPGRAAELAADLTKTLLAGNAPLPATAAPASDSHANA